MDSIRLSVGREEKLEKIEGEVSRVVGIYSAMKRSGSMDPDRLDELYEQAAQEILSMVLEEPMLILEEAPQDNIRALPIQLELTWQQKCCVRALARVRCMPRDSSTPWIISAEALGCLVNVIVEEAAVVGGEITEEEAASLLENMGYRVKFMHDIPEYIQKRMVPDKSEVQI